MLQLEAGQWREAMLLCGESSGVKLFDCVASVGSGRVSWGVDDCNLFSKSRGIASAYSERFLLEAIKFSLGMALIV